MSTWGIAKDMAARNAENLARLSKGRGVYKEYVKHGSSSEKNIYKYNESTPEMLAAIRAYKVAEKRRNLRKQLIIGLFCMGLFVAAFWMIFWY
jgi:hypothetical protein